MTSVYQIGALPFNMREVCDRSQLRRELEAGLVEPDQTAALLLAALEELDSIAGEESKRFDELEEELEAKTFYIEEQRARLSDAEDAAASLRAKFEATNQKTAEQLNQWATAITKLEGALKAIDVSAY